MCMLAFAFRAWLRFGSCVFGRRVALAMKVLGDGLLGTGWHRSELAVSLLLGVRGRDDPVWSGHL